MVFFMAECLLLLESYSIVKNIILNIKPLIAAVKITDNIIRYDF